jgi:hypothetical protein
MSERRFRISRRLFPLFRWIVGARRIAVARTRGRWVVGTWADRLDGRICARALELIRVTTNRALGDTPDKKGPVYDGVASTPKSARRHPR